MNPAPRTTQEEWEEWEGQWIVRADLARDLETELTEITARLHDLNLDLSTANHMIKLERDRADALQTRLNEIDAMLKSPDLID
jgi:predicted nuclease with TOPRIM domain